MTKLTRYDSYEALKADTNQSAVSEQEVIKRHLELKQVLEYLRNKYLAQKEKQSQISQQKSADDK